MKTLTFKVTVEVSELKCCNVEYVEDQLSRSIISSECLDVGPVDEMGASAKLLEIQDEMR